VSVAVTAGPSFVSAAGVDGPVANDEHPARIRSAAAASAVHDLGAINSEPGLLV
jgi:hypothetical protein